MALLGRVLQRAPRASAPIEDERMSVIEHLEALRRVLIVSLIAWAVATVGAFFISGRVISFLVGHAGIHNAVYLQDLSQFLSFVLLMIIGFGIVFELPVVLFVLGMLRIVSTRWLYKRRPYFFLGLGLVANFLTPGADPLTPLIMFIPLYLFFEGTALLLKLLGR